MAGPQTLSGRGLGCEPAGEDLLQTTSSLRRERCAIRGSPGRRGAAEREAHLVLLDRLDRPAAGLAAPRAQLVGLRRAGAQRVLALPERDRMPLPAARSTRKCACEKPSIPWSCCVRPWKASRSWSASGAR